jgi:hypothetical protein
MTTTTSFAPTSSEEEPLLASNQPLGSQPLLNSSNRLQGRWKANPYWFVRSFCALIRTVRPFTTIFVVSLGSFPLCLSSTSPYINLFASTTSELTTLPQRGMTLSPRIKVYNDIACRAVGSPIPDTHNIVTSLFADGCDSSEVQARASKIQACMFVLHSSE